MHEKLFAIIDPTLPVIMTEQDVGMPDRCWARVCGHSAAVVKETPLAGHRFPFLLVLCQGFQAPGQCPRSKFFLHVNFQKKW